ncbi:unnamed protein product [Colias eurytheme]|nr:unnamed protein product [Colias eurytheme]
MKFENVIKKHIKTVGKNNVVDDIFTSALFYQQIFGQQILDPNWTWKKYFVRQLLMLFLFIYVFLGTLQCLKINNDAELLAEACYTIIMIVIFPVKMGLFIKNSTIILDMWFVVLIYFMCSALKSLANMLQVEQKRYQESKEDYADRLENALRTFYRTHLKLNKFMITLCEMYKVSAFIPLCNAAICICLILLLMSKEVNWRFAPHMLPMFAEIFAYNWFGEQIKTKMNDVRLALLYFDWTNLKAKDKKSYYIMVTYMTKDFGIKTISGKDLSLITMTAVLKISYQAFTVLQTMDG